MFKVNFMSNQTVTAEDINSIGYNLANTVYTSFENDVTYGVDELNEITKNIVGPGVKREYKNMCAVSLVGTTVTIASGQAFFECGAVMTVDDEGITLELEDSTKTNYVYLFHNSALNVAGARCTTEIPSGLETVLLAEIISEEAIQNSDKFCKSKILDAPNTPLVVYNSAHDIAYNASRETEKIAIPNLSKYKMARIVSKTFVYRTSFPSGDKVYVSTPLLVFADLSKPFPETDSFVVFYAEFPGSRTPGYLCRNEDFVVLGYMDNYDESIDPYVAIQFDFNEDMIVLTFASGTLIDANAIKIELFAGEVTEL